MQSVERIQGPVLVTGASGYLASRLVPALIAAGVPVHLLSRRRPSLPIMVPYFVGSPDGDPHVLREAARGVRTIFHLAGQTSVAEARRDPYGDLSANVLGMLRLLEAVSNATQRPAIVFAGTVTEAGIPSGDPLDESAPDRPVTVYDIHKLAAEKHLELASKRGQVHGVTLRFANIYGPGAASGAADRGVLNQMLRRASHGEPLTVFGTGDRLRDYTFVDDIVDALVRAAAHAKPLSGRHFVIGSGDRRTMEDIIQLVAGRASSRLGRQVEVQYATPPPNQDPIDGRSYVVNASAFAKATGWAPTVTLEEGIDRTLDWIAERAHA
jgi:nucleoside-diphosphate-sugar epimerase